MDFDLTEEQLMVQRTARAFTEKEVKPVAAKLDREGVFPAELIRRLSEIGFMGTLVPLELDGSGMDAVSYVIAVEEISKAWASLGTIMTVNNSLVCEPIVQFGSEKQKRS
ncbi:MAG: acyl-CoA dehydrogenase family protein, partial [Deltaproteobacteria bacterium]|nr:acyl-CoA dehydrogenase family protein [Deltaproteobacteria bacterium]